MRSESEIRAEVHGLWTAVFGEPPIVEAPAKVLIDTLIASLPATDYAVIRRFGVAAPVDDAPSPAHASGSASERSSE